MNFKVSESGRNKGACLVNGAPWLPVFVNLLSSLMFCESGVKYKVDTLCAIFKHCFQVLVPPLFLFDAN